MAGFARNRWPDSAEYAYSKYEKGFFVKGASENVGLEIFRNALMAEHNKVNPKMQIANAKRFIDMETNDLLPAALSVLRKESGVLQQESRSYVGSNKVNLQAQEKAFTAVPTPSAVTMALISVEMMLDDLLNRANSAASSALFAMRGHVASTVSDLNVVFKSRMDETFDRLSVEEQKILTAAHVLAAQADRTIREVAAKGFEEAADLVCQTTVGLANFNPLSRLLPPDIVCLKERNIRDAGPNMERLITFRGVNLLPIGGDYPRAKLTVGGSTLDSVTAGGNTVLLMPIPGGLNGRPDDLTLRGERIAQTEFFWQNSKVTRRWLFPLKPYLVRSIEVTLIPLIKGPVRKEKTQVCSVHANGGSLGSREEYATCTILVDNGWEIESCTGESNPTTANGEAGVRNKLQSVGACQWEMHAKSKSFYGGGAWYGFIGKALMKKLETVRGPVNDQRKVLNQNTTSAVFTYPPSLVPPEYQIMHGDWEFTVRIVNNEGRDHTLTNSQPAQADVGVATMANGTLTVTVPQ